MMKRTICIRVLTVLLAVCMLWQTVGAVPFSGDWAGTMWSRLLGRWSGDGLETNSTDTAATNAANGTELVYFPVTLYNYDTDKINAVTHQMEVDAALAAGGIRYLRQWNGMYFNNGTPADESFVYETGGTESAWVPVSLDEITDTGKYVIVNYRTMKAGYISETTDEIRATDGQVASSKGAHVGTGNTAIQRATKWTIEEQPDGTYHIYTGEQYIEFYRNYQRQWDVRVSDSPYSLVIQDAGHGDNSVSIGNGRNWLNSHDYLGVFSAWDESGENDPGSRFYIYQLKENVSSTDTTDSLPYAEWNFWKKGGDTNRTGQYTYSGLVEPLLSPRKELILTKTDPGLFTTTAVSGKTVYTNVEMPFTFNSETGMYTFDASANGVYFKEDAAQGSTTARSNGRLYFDATGPQSNGGSYGDGSTTVWMPFNSTRNIDGEDNCDYHFGMQAVLPFTMTANGRVNPIDEQSDAITFDFSGDDDVWVFIDGILVGDLGGIHNRLNLTLDFAANSWEIWENNDAGENEDPPGFPVDDYNGAELIGKLFNDSEGAGILGQTRASFAATSEHTLTVFYLERGAGSSNCKIEFNLPMNDTLSVTKRATQSWTDKDNNNVMDEGELSPLTPAEQTIVNNQDFHFILTKDGEPVSNRTYILTNAAGQYVNTLSTDAYGHFVLRNGQTARFIGEIAAEGNVYQVEEIIPGNRVEEDDGDITFTFSCTVWRYSGSAGGFGYVADDNAGEYDPSAAVAFTATTTADATQIPSLENIDPWDGDRNFSRIVKVLGSDDRDSLNIISTNYLNASLPNPGARPAIDQIVIDYGLGVEIDVLSNDLWRGSSIALTDVTGARFGNAAVEGDKVVYNLTQQLTEPEVLTYTVTVTAESGETSTANGKAYIFPATSMYYEENFTGLVTFTKGEGFASWTTVGEAQTDKQEPGVVGTMDDSPYGSDAAYTGDSGDSNDTSYYMNTTNGYGQFSYTFTGTGTSFFARTGLDTGYIRIVIEDTATGETETFFRDTIYVQDANNVKILSKGEYLYNIPVFTWNAETYGTYTVTVSVATDNTRLDFGNEFYLDGIRVMNPLNSALASHEDETVRQNYGMALAAYATDGEANMTTVTVRDKLLSMTDQNENGELVWTSENFILFTDSNGCMTSAEDYSSFGPKEEVYMYGTSTITFSLRDWDADTNRIYLGLKAPTGSASVTVNGETFLLTNAADCYYEIPRDRITVTTVDGVTIATFEISVPSGSLVSVTNIKVTGNAQFVIIDQQDLNNVDANA